MIHVIGVCHSCHFQTISHISHAHTDRILYRCHCTKVDLHDICANTAGFLHHDGFDQSNISANAILIGVLRDQIAVLQHIFTNSSSAIAGILPILFFVGIAAANHTNKHSQSTEDNEKDHTNNENQTAAACRSSCFHGFLRRGSSSFFCCFLCSFLCRIFLSFRSDCFCRFRSCMTFRLHRCGTFFFFCFADRCIFFCNNIFLCFFCRSTDTDRIFSGLDRLIHAAFHNSFFFFCWLLKRI